jgi:hypothetical protein
MAFQIVVPSAAVTIAPRAQSKQKPVNWVAAPPKGRAIEFSALLTGGVGEAGAWPGRGSMATELIGNMPLASGEYVRIVSREIDVPQLRPFESGNLMRFTKDVPDLKGARVRLIVFGSTEDGARFIFESLLDSGSIPKLQQRLAGDPAGPEQG